MEGTFSWQWAVPTINIDSLSRDWGVGKEKVYLLLDNLEHLGVIHVVRYASDVKATGKGAKIFLADLSLYFALGGSRGNVRFTQFLCCLLHSRNAQVGLCGLCGLSGF